ncbi:MAG: orotate phosphoribosyltransferase [Chthonomonadales bacterium]
MTNDEALQLFVDAGALLKGHFKLSSGLHSGDYLEKFRLAENPVMLEPMCQEIADRFANSGVEIVLGPVTAGIILAYNVARLMKVEARFAERVDAALTLRRGQVLEPGTKVLIVDDIFTTGGAVKECLELAKTHGADIVGVGVLGDRSGGTIDLGTRLEAVLQVKVEAFMPETCPQCAAGVPIYQPGSRALHAAKS